MEKEELFELARQLGIKRANFDLGYVQNRESMEKQILEVSKYLGLLKNG